jgi:hypothetical protein
VYVLVWTTLRARRAARAVRLTVPTSIGGINIIAFYSSTIFVEAGYTPRNALKASLGFGAINFLFAFPAIFTIDTFGRRNLLLLTFPNMAWSLLAAGLCFLIPREMTAHLGLIGAPVQQLCQFLIMTADLAHTLCSLSLLHLPLRASHHQLVRPRPVDADLALARASVFRLRSSASASPLAQFKKC